MDSSSDGSFAWTDASNDTIDSGVRLNDKMNKTHSEDESVSGKSYKKQLQEELFTQSNKSVEDENHHKPKKRKRKLTEEQSGSEHASPKKKKIKREPESDIDTSAGKPKTNGHIHNESHDSYDESYLDSKVKAEQLFAAPLVKTKKKKKKSKKRHDSENGETNHDESHLAEEEMVVGGNGSVAQYVEEPEINVNTQVVTFVEDTKVNNKKPSNRDPDECRERDSDREKQQVDSPADTNVSFNIPTNKSVRRSSKISERIQFEEDESSEMETSELHSDKTSTKSSKLKTFLKNNSNLKPVMSKLKSESVLTADDEVWIIRCPKDVNIDAFQNKDLMVEGRCKLKLNGQTYEGIMDDVSGNMSILSSEKSDFVIKSLSVKGCLNLRKRIPKQHILDESIVGNQTNFIPLPETKCRHPLFGSNFRKAIKLPASVAERLRNTTTSALVTPERAKKKRQSKESSMLRHDGILSTPKAEPNLESSVMPKEETDQPVASKKKKKKRKHSEPEEIAPKQKKRKKHDLESAEAWESEQAIEENLFNF